MVYESELEDIYGDDDRGVREVFDESRYLDLFPRGITATCGHCGRTWDDGHPSSVTPVPAARCPFEYDHVYDDGE